ncbi:HNH endonuclease [Nocardiopsis sp. NPDC007018]|uniref:HNH endonuclease signature motif containing protein n=1 Tax=Nocardiopsis sp. NPDC007018 TaxID=3155721 RepID=UPI0034091D0F
MRAAREQAALFFDREWAPGSEGEVLDQATRVWEELDLIKLHLVAAVARVEASGQLLDQGGQRDLATWMRHSFGVSATQANEMAGVGRATARHTFADTTRALRSGSLSFGEAAAVVRSVERAVDRLKLNTTDHPDPDLFRKNMEHGLLAFKAEHPTTSVVGLGRAALQLGARLDPHRAERDHATAHAQRGARLSRTDAGSFLFQAWGSAADALRVEAVLEGFANPHDPEGGLSREQRTFDAFLNAASFAQTHHGCERAPSPVAMISVLIPATTLAGAPGDDPATTENGRVVPTSAVRELLGESLVRHLMVQHRTGAVLDVGHEYRTATPAIKTAAFAGHTTCAWRHGCDVPLKWTQADHIIEWWQGGRTSAENIQPLCSTHNRLKHRWGLRKDRTMWAGRNRGHPPTPPGSAPDPPPGPAPPPARSTTPESPEPPEPPDPPGRSGLVPRPRPPSE